MAKTKTEKQTNTLDNGVLVDVSEISNELTDRAKRFVFFFSFPGTDCFQHKTRSAIRAGYAKKNAVSSGYKLCQNPVVKREIQRLSEIYLTETIDALYKRYIETLETRAFYDPNDFISGTTFKPIKEIAPEKRICLDQAILDARGEIVGYTFGSRRSAFSEIRELQKENPGRNDDDEEETMEIIMERLTIKKTIRKAKDEVSQIAGLMRLPAGEEITEL